MPDIDEDRKAAVDQFNKVFKKEEKDIRKQSQDTFLRDFKRAYLHMRSFSPLEVGAFTEALAEETVSVLQEGRTRLAYAFRKDLMEKNADIGFASGILLGFTDYILRDRSKELLEHGYDLMIVDLARSYDLLIKKYYEVDLSFIRKRMKAIISQRTFKNSRIKVFAARFLAEFVVKKKSRSKK